MTGVQTCALPIYVTSSVKGGEPLPVEVTPFSTRRCQPPLVCGDAFALGNVNFKGIYETDTQALLALDPVPFCVLKL